MVPNFLKFAYEHGWIVSSLEGLIAKDYIVGHLDGNHGNLYPRQEEFTDSGVKYISANAITGGQIDFSKAKFLSNERANKFKKGVAVNGDVIFAHNATVGPVAVLETTDEKVILSTSLTYYRTNKEKIDARYLSQFMSSSAFTRQYESIMRQTTRNQIPITTQREFLFAIPPLSEQKKIAQILSTWDKAITTTEQLLANSQQQQKALMQQLLTGKKRLLDKNGVRFSGEWDIVNLDSVCDVKGGKRLPKGSYLSENKTPYPYIRVADMFMGGVDVASIQYVPEDIAPSIQRYRIFKDDLFITVAGTLGIVGEIPDALDGANLTENADKLTNIKCDKTYLLYVMKSDLIQKYIEAESTQNAQPKLALTRIRSFKVPTPGKEEQQKIAAVLSTADQEITALQQKLNALKQEKKALMQQLLTGKRRVKIN